MGIASTITSSSFTSELEALNCGFWWFLSKLRLLKNTVGSRLVWNPVDVDIYFVSRVGYALLFGVG